MDEGGELGESPPEAKIRAGRRQSLQVPEHWGHQFKAVLFHWWKGGREGTISRMARKGLEFCSPKSKPYLPTQVRTQNNQHTEDPPQN